MYLLDNVKYINVRFECQAHVVDIQSLCGGTSRVRHDAFRDTPIE